MHINTIVFATCNHDHLVKRENPTPEAAWCGEWYDCPTCGFSTLIQSDELKAQLEGQKKRYRRQEEQAVLAKLSVESVDIHGDLVNIVECLSKTVDPQRCIAIAQRLRDRNLSCQKN